MSDSRRFDLDDLALFAMQLLSKEEEAQVRASIASSPELQRELAEVHGDLAIYATTVEMHAPPAISRDRLLSQVGRERKSKPIERLQEPAAPVYGAGMAAEEIGINRQTEGRLTADDLPAESTGLERAIPWIGWAIAAGLAIASGNFYHESRAMRESNAHFSAELTRRTAEATAAKQLMDTLRDPAATRVTLTRSQETPTPQGRVTYAADTGSLLFTASNLEPLEHNKVYELWLIPANGQAPTPAGVFHPDFHGNATVVLPRLPTGLVARAFGITIEEEDGAQTPTMPIILSGAAGGA